MNSEQFKKHREDLGFTQKQLSDKLCVSYHTVVKWENGSPIPLCCQKLFCLMFDLKFILPGKKDKAWSDSPDLPFT